MARMSKAAEADWQRRYRESGTLYTQAECGCVVFMLTDMPEEVKYSAKELAEQIAKGREVKRAERVNGVLQGMPPDYCPEHDRSAQRVADGA